MRLLRSELRLRWVSLLLWCVAVLLVMLLIVAFYPSMRDDPSLNSIYAGLSESAQGLLGGSDLTSPAGYLSTQVFAFFLPVVLLVFGLAARSRVARGRGGGPYARPVARAARPALVGVPAEVGRAAGRAHRADLIDVVAAGAARTGRAASTCRGRARSAVCVQMGLFCLALSLWAQAISAATGRRGVGLAVVSAMRSWRTCCTGWPTR